MQRSASARLHMRNLGTVKRKWELSSTRRTARLPTSAATATSHTAPRNHQLPINPHKCWKRRVQCGKTRLGESGRGCHSTPGSDAGWWGTFFGGTHLLHHLGWTGALQPHRMVRAHHQDRLIYTQTYSSAVNMPSELHCMNLRSATVCRVRCRLVTDSLNIARLLRASLYILDFSENLQQYFSIHNSTQHFPWFQRHKEILLTW